MAEKEVESRLISDLAAQFFLEDLDNEIDGMLCLSITTVATLALGGLFRALLGAIFGFEWLNPYSQVMLMVAILMISLLISGLVVGISVGVHNKRRRDFLVKNLYALMHYNAALWNDLDRSFGALAQETIGRNSRKDHHCSARYSYADFWVECPRIERFIAIRFSRKVAKMLRAEFAKLAEQWYVCFGLWDDARHLNQIGAFDAAKGLNHELEDAVLIYRMIFVKVEKLCTAAVREATKAK